MKKFLLGDFYNGDRVVLADGRDAVVVRLEDGDRLRVRTVDGRDVVVHLKDVIARDGPAPG